MSKNTWAVLAMLAVVAVGGGWYYYQNQPPKEVRAFDLLIDWQNEPTYIGVYYAKHLGLFRDIGLDVNVIQSWGANPAVASVAGGKYPVATASGGATVLGHNNESDVVSTAVIYEKVPTSIYSLVSKNIRTPKDLEGKRIGIYPGSITANEFDAFVKVNNVDKSKLRIVSLTGADIPLVLADQVDAVLNYTELSAVILQLNQDLPLVDGKRVNEIKLADYGVGGYGLNVVANKNYEELNSKLVGQITDAIVDGYRLGCRDKEDAVNSFVAEFPDKDPAYVKASWDVVCSMLTTPVGRQTEARWKETVDLYQGLGLLTSPVDPATLFVR